MREIDSTTPEVITAVIMLATTFGIAAALTWLLTPIVIRLCHQRGWLAHPGPRHIHRVPTPTVGGVAILTGIIAAMLLSFSFNQFTPLLQRTAFEQLRITLLLTGVLLVASVSLIDDVRPLSPWVRLPVHGIAALIVVGPYLWDPTLYPDIHGHATEARGIILTAFNFPYVGQIHLHHMSHWLAIAATLFWIVGIQNMLNWVDGLDGLAASITVAASLILAAHAVILGQWTIAILPIALAGACVGFLPFNFPPARVFMGDVGAMALGYLLAISAILGGAKLATALLVLGIPAIDMAWLILWRALRGYPVAISGRDHLHHHLLDLGYSQRQIVALYCTVSVAFGSVALLDTMTAIGKLVILVLMGCGVLTLSVYATMRSQSQHR